MVTFEEYRDREEVGARIDGNYFDTHQLSSPVGAQEEQHDEREQHPRDGGHAQAPTAAI